MNTKIYLLLYKDKIFQKGIPLENFKIMRFDKGIYGQVWDGANNLPEFKDLFKKQYDLDDDEYQLLQFYYYWCEDLLEVVDEETFDSANNFKKVPTDKVVTPKVLNKILEKVYRYEKERIMQFENSFLADTIRNPSNEIFKTKPSLKSILKNDSSIEIRFSEIEKRTKEFLQTRPVVDFLNLLGLIIGCLTILENDNDDTEVQIIFYGY